MTAPVLKLPRSNSRTYVDETGAEWPRVTTVCGVLDKPALMHWAANLERDACLEAALLAFDESETPEDFARAMKGHLGPAKAHARESQKAIEIGSQAHAHIEWTLRRELGLLVGPEPHLSDAAMRAALGFFDWRDTVDLKVLAVEQRLYSRLYRVAGTADLIGVLHASTKPEVIVADWKTSKGLYDEMLLQNGAYVFSAAEMYEAGELPWRPTAGLILRLPKTEEDPGFEAYHVPADQQVKHATAFWHAAQLYAWLRERELAKRSKA